MAPQHTTVDDAIYALVEGWCDRRDLGHLRIILAAWPRTTDLTDDWAMVMEALRDLRASRSLPEDEQGIVERLVTEVEHAVYRT